MKYVFEEGERRREVEIRRVGDGEFEAVVDGQRLTFRARPLGAGFLRLESEGREAMACVSRRAKTRFVTLEGRDWTLERGATGGPRRTAGADHGPGEMSMPMPGLVVRVEVQEGERVARGQPLLVVEAMKMEHTLRAPRDGTVTRLAAEPGKLIDAGAVLLEIEA